MAAINLTMFGTPETVYQSLNINQLTTNCVNIAYQVNDSLLAGNNVSSTYTPNNTVALNYGITGNQSAKLSSGYLTNILAQSLTKNLVIQSAKSLADVSAKIYANQSILTTNGGWDSSENLKRGEFTPLAKSEVTAGLEVLSEPLKGKIIEFFESIKRESVELSESIKKGSQSATLGDVDIKYRASERLKLNLVIRGGKYVHPAINQNFDDNHFTFLLTFGYSKNALAKSSARIGVLNNILATHDAPSVFFCVHAYAHLLNAVLYRAYSMVAAVEQPKGWLVSLMSSYANSAVVTTPEIGVSSGDSLQNIKEIIVMMATPTQTQFKFLFLSIKRSDTTAKPCRIAVTASNEHDARLMLVRDYILSFAGRLPAQEVTA